MASNRRSAPADLFSDIIAMAERTGLNRLPEAMTSDR